MDLKNDIALVAERYRAEGYSVTRLTNGAQLPPFASTFHLDLLATRGDLNVLVQVKESQQELAADSSTAEMARVINSQPGWRFDLVVLGHEDAVERLLREGEEPTAESLSSLLDSVEQGASTSTSPSGFILAWGALEAAMRRAAREAGIEVTQFSPLFLLGTLYSNGLLERQEYDELNKLLRVRNAIVHGLEVPQLDIQATLAVASAARKLLMWDSREVPV